MESEMETPVGTVSEEGKIVPDPAERDIVETKEFRVALDVVLSRLKDAPRKSRERSIAVTKLQEAIMWLGMDLKDMGNANPYPNSYNPANTIVDPTADNLRL